MRHLFFTTAISVFLGVAVHPLHAAEEEKEITPQAQPVYRWLKSVKEEDQALLKSVFSKEFRQKFEETGWDKVMKVYRDVFPRTFGEYELDEFSFDYQGETSEGRVTIKFKDKKFPGVRVIKEGDAWKVNER